MRGKNLAYFILIVVVLAFAFMHLYIYTKSYTLKYETTNLKIKFRELKNQNRILASRLSSAQALNKIEKKAISEMDMHYPETVNYIVITAEVK